MGRTIDEALARSAPGRQRALPLLVRHARRGGAHRAPTRSRYLAAYADAIAAIGACVDEPECRCSRSRRSRSSCRRCIRATNSRSAAACSPSSCRALLELARRARERGIGADRRRGGSRAARAVARDLRARASRCRARRLAKGSGSRCRPTRSARRPVFDWLEALARDGRPAHPGAPGQGRVLGHRDQARAGARPRRLSGVHAQGAHRRVVPRVRARACSTARDAPVPACSRRTTRTRSRGSRGLRERAASRIRVPAPARDGRSAVRAGCSPTGVGIARAASTRPSAATRTCCRISCGGCSRTAPTRRSSTASPTPSSPDRRHRRRSGRGDAHARRRRAPADPAAARPVRAAAPQLARTYRSPTRRRWPRSTPRSPRRDRAHGAPAADRRRASARRAPRATRSTPPTDRAVSARSSSGRGDRRPRRSTRPAQCQPAWNATPAARRARRPRARGRRDRARALDAEFVALLAREAGKSRVRRHRRSARGRRLLPLLRGDALRAAFAAPVAAARAHRRIATTLSLHRPRRVRRASARGIFRSRSSPARSRRRSPRATRSSPSPPSNAAHRAHSRCSCSLKPASPRGALHCVPGDGEIVGAALRRRSRASRASCSPARPRSAQAINRTLARAPRRSRR